MSTSGLAPVTYSYDGRGRLTTTVEGEGASQRTTVLSYDALGRLSSRTDALGAVTTYGYDAAGRRIAETLPTGQTLNYAYDAMGNLTAQQDARGVVTTYEYDAANRRVAQVADAGGLAVRSEYTFDAAGNLVAQTEDAGAGRLNLSTRYTYTLAAGSYRTGEVMDAAGNVRHFVYNTAGEVVSETDALQQTTTYTSGYSATGRWAQVTTPGGRTTTTESNPEGQPLRITDAAGGVTLYAYDALGRLHTTTTGAAPIGGQPALNRTITTTYDVHGRIVAVTDALGNTATRNYDAFGRLASESDPLGNTTLYTYDALDRLVRVTTGANVPGEALSTAYTYDAVGRKLTMHVDPDGLNLTTQYRYTRPGSSDTWSLQEVVDAKGNVTAYSYNSLGQLAATTDALNQTWRFTYDNLGRQVTQSDPLSRTTTYAVDALGRRTSLTLDGRTEQWAYRPDGALAGTMDFAGRVTSFGYSLDGELTAIDYPAGTADVSYAYDAVGNVVSMSDGLGVTSYSYDVLGQRLTRTRNGRTVSYAYTANGQIGQVGYWNRGGVQYAHDAAGRLTGLAPWGATATSYTYRSTGLLAGETRPNGANTLYTYDTASRLTGLNGIGYVLDANGNRTQMTDWEGATTYSYDALDRLAQAIYPTATVTYTLDSTGNRLSDGMVSFTYDPSDRIMNPGFVYDTNGNLLADGMATYEYDAANRLIQMTRSGVVTTYGYDGWGNLIQETVNGVTTEFVLDENTAYTRILGEVRSDGGERLYAYGPEGFSAQLAVGGTVEYPLLDGLGSVRQLTDAAGTVILSRSYDAFGNVRFVAGTGGSRLGYTGEMQDSVSGLVYLRARHYHPVLGRFLQRDSFGGSGQRPQSLNRYSYTENNPVNLVDPSGHIAVCFQGSPKYTVGEGSSSIRFCREALREGGYREGGGENDHGPILGYAAVGIGYWEAYRSVFDAHAERPEEPVIIFGYSWGAVTAMNLAWELYGHSDTPNTCPLNPVPIDLLMLFEFEDFGRLAIHETPPNVKSAVNFYAPWADSQPNPTADGVNEIRGATNIPVRRTPDGDDADHFSIINLQAGDRHESDIYTPPEKRHPPEPPVPDAEAELNDNTINRAADYVRQVMMRH